MKHTLTLVLAASCLSLAALAAPSGQDWPQWRGKDREGIWREKGIVQKFAGEQIPIKWRVPVANGYSGPTVANGRVYVTDRITEPSAQERVHCFDAETGKQVWTHAWDAPYGGVGYPDGPRASVTVHEGRAYALGAVGHMYAFDAAKGTVLWNRDLGKEYEIRLPNWGTATAPLVEGENVILQISGSNGSCIVSLDRKTGKERWKALDDLASYSPPVTIEQGGRRIVLVWTAGRMVALDPNTGAMHYEAPFPASMWPIAVAQPVVQGKRVFLSSAIDGSLMLQLRQDGLGADKVWQRKMRNNADTDVLHCLISTPYIEGDYIYGVNINGELRCLEAETGKRVWQSEQPVPVARWAAAHLIRGEDRRTWIFNEKGQLIIAKLSPQGYEEISRASLIKPTLGQLRERGGVTWAHPAFAYGHVFARNDEELVCADLRAR